MSIEEINEEAVHLAETIVRVHAEAAKQMRARISGMCANILLDKYHYDVSKFLFERERLRSMSWLV
jgi:hypothetical protein